MSDTSNTDERVGWERIWRSTTIPEKYGSFAAPNQAIVEWADTLTPGSAVLDIGCGVGRHCVYLGQRGFQVAGTDISPTAIDLTRKICAENGIAFDGRVADMQNLPWPDAVFDGALSTSTIHHHLRPNMVKVLAEVRRVLKPGGLFVADFLSIDMIEQRKLREQVAAGELTEPEPNTFVDVRPDIDDMNDAFLPHHFSDEADLRDLLRDFEIIKLWIIQRSDGTKGQWVVSARRPLAD